VNTDLTLLRDLLIIFAVAVTAVALLRKLRVPPIAGFILSGAIIGPNALGLITDVHEVETLAEVGVVLLLFGIGLEMSVGRLRRLWRPIVIGGTIQVGLTIVAVTAVASWFGMRLGSAIFLGCVFAISSTAIVLRGMQARQEVDAPHGRFALGVLLFQDLCVVPMILVIPLLAGSSGSNEVLFIALFKSVGVLAVVLVAAWFVVPRLLLVVARTRQRDLFVLTVLSICLGTAWVLTLVGISLALGAFLAGLIVAGSEFRHEAMSDVIPFREVLTSVFFVSVGMFLDVRVVTESFWTLVALLAAILLGKFLIVWITGAIMRFPARVNIVAAGRTVLYGDHPLDASDTHRDCRRPAHRSWGGEIPAHDTCAWCSDGVGGTGGISRAQGSCDHCRLRTGRSGTRTVARGHRDSVRCCRSQCGKRAQGVRARCPGVLRRRDEQRSARAPWGWTRP
jgi:CPA2 family monovalent cation:H+ antiporter-2